MEIAKLLVKVGADISDMESQLSKAQRGIEDTGRKMQKIGRGMTMAITAPLAAIGGASIKAAGDFEDSFANIRKTVDATEPVFQTMSDEIRQLSRTVPTSVEELNRLGGVAGQLGVEADNIVDFTKVIAQLGDTTDIAGEQAALSLSRFMNVMGTAEGDIDRLGATIVGLGNNFAAMESEIVDISTSMAPLGNAIGLTEQNVLALSTAIAASGGEARAASTAFQKTANTMQRAVLEGTEDLQIFAETAGMSAEQFRKAFQEDSFEALITFMEGLRRTQQEGESMAAVLDQIGLADQRLIREFGKVTGNLDQVRKAAGMANQEWERNTALTEEAQKRYDTFNSRMRTFWNTVKDLGITIGNELIPFVTKLTDIAKGAIGVFQNLSPAVRKLGIAFSALLAVSGPIIWFLGTMATHVGTLVRVMPKLTSAVYGLGTAIKSTMAGLSGYVGLIAALGFASYKAAQRSEDRMKALGKEATSVSSVAEANEKLIETEEKIANMRAQMSRGAGGAGLQRRLEDLIQLRDALIEQRNMLASQSGDVGSVGFSGLAELQDFINTDLSNAFGNVSDKAQNTGQQIGTTFSTSIDNASGNISLLDNTLNDVSTGGLQKVSGAMDSVKEAMKVTGEEAKVMGQALQQAATGAITSFAETLGNAFTGDAGASGFFNNLLMIVVDFANQFGKLLVAAGVAAQAFKSLLANPFAAIAAGTALIAATTAVKNLLQKGPKQEAPALAQGGLAFGPTMAVVGDNRNARSDPEVIAPLSKLQGIMANSGGGTTKVEGIIRGSDIHLANERGKNKFR